MIELEPRGRTSVLSMHHGKANALDLELLRELDRSLQEFEASEQRALVLTGHGKIFCAGVDLYRLLEGGDDYLDEFLAALVATLRRLYALEKPVVAALNGHAIAGGCLFAVACDHRVMAAGKGKVGVSELYVGVPFPTIGLEIMRNQLAPHVVEDLVFSGRLCSAEESRSLGLVHRIVSDEELMEVALSIADHFGSVLPETYALTKRELRQPALRAIDTEFAEMAEAVAARWRDEEVRATIREFLDATIGKGRE